MGSPDKTEAYEMKSGGAMMFLFYRTQIGYNLLDKHWASVCFIDGKLKGWAQLLRRYHQDSQRDHKKIILTKYMLPALLNL